MLQDGAANKFAWSIKGDAGSRFCILCKNLFAKTSLIMQDGEEILTSSMHKAHGLKFASNQDIKSSIARLQRKKLEYTAEAFKDWEQACGFVYQEKSLLLDPDLQHVLNPANNFVHDWMHAILANGIMATILTLLLKTLGESKEFDAHDTFGNYLQKWTFPKALKLQPHSLFSKKRKKSNQEANTFKATASEFLGMYAILSFFMQTVLIPAKHCVEACNVFIELGNLLDILQAIPICSITPAHLQTAVEAFFDAVETAHWVDSFHSKFHWLVHLPAELEYLKCLPSCFCLERKHKAVKKFAQATSNLKNYEAGVLMDVVAQELYDLKERPGIFLGAIALEHHGLPTKYFKELISKYVSFTECFTCSTLLLQPAGKACKGDFITWCEGEKFLVAKFACTSKLMGKFGAWFQYGLFSPTRQLYAQQTGQRLMTPFWWTMFVYLQKQPGQQTSSWSLPNFCSNIEDIFCGDFNPSVGLTLKGPHGQHQKLFLSFGGMLQDGAANKFAWSIKGDAGSRFCILCKNLFAKTSLIMQDGEEILTSSMHKAHGLKFASNQDIKSSIARLQRKKLEYTAEAFKDWEQACGFVYQEKSLLLDPDLQHVLNPANNFVHDWMHAILANGIMATILTLLLKTLGESKEFDAHDTFGNYLQKWTFPKALKLQPHSLFHISSQL